MIKKQLNGEDLANMFVAGAAILSNRASEIDALNVFPAPDGDTGSNMRLSMDAGIAELKKLSRDRDHAGKVAQAMSKGLLMGARGNSGVILSQLFRGFSNAINEDRIIDAKKLAAALSNGVVMAYDAVMEPVEGTILTVAKDAAVAAEEMARRTEDLTQVLNAVFEAANESLSRTPELLPVLKKVGVVDSGGQGLTHIYEGFYRALLGEKINIRDQGTEQKAAQNECASSRFEEERAQIHMRTDDISQGYCVEFLIKKSGEKSEFQLSSFRERIGRYGDSLLVVEDDGWVKVHIHSERPGKALDFGQRYGELSGIKIENMREQHAKIVSAEEEKRVRENAVAKDEEADRIVPYGVVAVATGEGMIKIFKSLGVHRIVEGGQSMNPSAEQLAEAARQISAERVIFLPNNKNIILAAEQVARYMDLSATVIPSRTMPQGMAALLALRTEAPPDENKRQMMDAMSRVKTGQVARAERDAKFDRLEIKQGAFIGMLENEIVVTGPTEREVALRLLAEMIDEETELVSIFYGIDLNRDQAEAFAEQARSKFEDVEIELYNGGQPIYSYIFSVE